MRVHYILILAVILPIVSFARYVADSYDLEVKLITPYNPSFTMLTTVRTNQPFMMMATNGSITNTVSGTLLPSTNGIYPLELTVSEWQSSSSNIRDTTKLGLELGKTWGGGPISSFAYLRFVTLRKHESIIK